MEEEDLAMTDLRPLPGSEAASADLQVLQVTEAGLWSLEAALDPQAPRSLDQGLTSDC